MSQLWLPGRESEWTILPLDNESLVLSESPPRRFDVSADPAKMRSLAVVMPVEEERSALLWGVERDVRINGIPQYLGMRVLVDRDEVRISGAPPFYYSTERLAKVEPFPGSDRPIKCARSKITIEKGMPAVRCPCCEVWYLQSTQYPSWTYGEHCLICKQPTDLDHGFLWTPAEL